MQAAEELGSKVVEATSYSVPVSEDSNQNVSNSTKQGNYEKACLSALYAIGNETLLKRFRFAQFAVKNSNIFGMKTKSLGI